MIDDKPNNSPTMLKYPEESKKALEEAKKKFDFPFISSCEDYKDGEPVYRYTVYSCAYKGKNHPEQPEKLHVTYSPRK